MARKDFHYISGSGDIEIGVEDGVLVQYVAGVKTALGGGGGSTSLSALLVTSTDAGASKITNLADPTQPQDAATKHYVDGVTPPTPTLTSILASSTDAGAHKITNVTDPTAAQDAATKNYVDNASVVQETTTARTLALTDNGKTIECTNASAVTVTVPANASVAFPVGSQIELVQIGAGTITVAAAGGVTLDSPGGTLTSGAQYATIVLRKRGTDEWVVGGELSAARDKDTFELQLAPLGCVAANFLPAEVAANSSPSSQSLYAMRVGLRKGMSITGLKILLGVAAVGTAPTGIFVGLADTNGVVLVQSGNLNGTAFTATGFLNLNFGSTYTVPADGSYYAFILVNGTWGTTQPQFQRLGGTMIDDTRVDARQGGLSTPPANGASLTLVNTAVLHYWVGCLGS